MGTATLKSGESASLPLSLLSLTLLAFLYHHFPSPSSSQQSLPPSPPPPSRQLLFLLILFLFLLLLLFFLLVTFTPLLLLLLLTPSSSSFTEYIDTLLPCWLGGWSQASQAPPMKRRIIRLTLLLLPAINQ